ncbi:hypothetical protein ONZ45_g12762 [Pleurotus djamor]|nr:hypothetical protein ONZ45_g12762 [Pleurotus djamor]
MRAQLFMSGVKFTDKAEDVKIALAHILHGPPFPLDGKLNFHVRLFYSRGGTHSGTGLVTFPHADFAGTFLALYPTVTISGRQVRFIQNRKEDDRALVDKVASTPWEDPERVRRQRQAIVESSSSISLSAASFGRFCPDGVFSAEVDVIDATIACDAGKRHLRLDGSADDFESTADYFSPSFASIMAALDIEGPDHSAYYRPSSIIAIADSSTTHIARVFIEANQPPTFVRSVTNGFTHKVDETRLSSLEGCRREMPPVSRGLCLTFHSQGELAIFIHRSKMLHLPHPITKPIPVEYRDLYAPQAVAGLDGFLAQLPFPLAFELNKSVLSGMLTPVNVYRDLKQAILTLLAEEPENAAPIFRSFVSSLRTPGIEAIKIPPVKSRRRRRRTPRRTAATLSEKLAHVTADYFSGPDQPTGRLSFRANNTNTAVCLSYHLRITPSARFLEGPLPDQSNSVLRRFGNHECFLRVTFQEESGSKLRQEGGSTHELLRDRYRPYLVNGVKVAGRHYDFLGYSMSGLKEYAFTFSRPFVFEGKLMDASDIRSSLGDFSAIDKKPALLAARWSQAFSASAPSVTLNPDSIQSIPDRDALDGSCFTDGVGTISLNLAQDVQNALRYHRRRARHTNEPPSALQIRFGGAKGVLVVDPRLYGRVVCLRESQTKFKGTGRTLDIATTSARPILTYLNRPLIVLLEHHGVNGNYIKQLQDLMVEEVTSILRGFDSAAAILTQNGLGTSFGLPSLLRHLHSILGIRHHLDLQHPSGLDHQLIFTSLHYAETHILREIKHRAHIRVPGSYTLIGVADEWDCLNEGEIYATVVDEENEVHEDIVGKVLITRSPQIHPGDAQMVTAVRRPQLAHLRNVVVFPCR